MDYKCCQSMHPLETGLQGLTRETKSSNTTKILKKAKTSPYETDIKSHQTCTCMKQMCSCLTYIKTWQRHQSMQAGLHGPTRKTNSSNTGKEHTNEGLWYHWDAMKVLKK